jgi:hypothetical protein
MAEAAKATTMAESTRLVNEATAIRATAAREAAAGRELDFADAIVQDHLVPVRVHEHHTASTDWLSEIDTGVDLRSAEHDILAQATLWYSKTAAFVKEYPEEFNEQAKGKARHMAGAYGESADEAENLFLTHVSSLHAREIKSGTVKVAADQLAQATTQQAGGYPADVFPTGNYEQALPGEATTSERAPQLAELEGAPSSGASDVTPENDPGLGVTNSTADQDNGDEGTQRSASKTASGLSSDQLDAARGMSEGELQRSIDGFPAGHPLREALQQHLDKRNAPYSDPSGLNFGSIPENYKGASMQHAQCPTCGGGGRVAVRTVPANTKVAYSGLPEIQQVVDPSDTKIQPTPLPQEVAWPWTMDPNNIPKAIQQTEQQLAERETRKGASRQQQAEAIAREAYRRVMAGGYDDSGWAGDMGAGGWQPGQQDGGNQPSSNLGQPDPVYGYGGDQGDRAIKPYGADEAENETNNPAHWAPGQPTQMDMGGRQQSTNGPTTYQQGPNSGAGKMSALDPEIAKAQQFIAQRQAFLVRQQQSR